MPRRGSAVHRSPVIAARRRAGPAVVLSCEHAGFRVPARWLPLFDGADAVLGSHRGWDPGAAPLAGRLALALGAPLIQHPFTRLLADVNRSPGHPRLFSEFTRRLPGAERDRIVTMCWTPHRVAVESAVEAEIRQAGSVMHVGVHSFTPVLDGRVRAVDVGLLYDPSRRFERAFASVWIRAARASLPGLRVRANQPYRGRSDGLTTALRGCFPDDRYLGLELEVGQGLLETDGRFPARVTDGLGEAFRSALATFAEADLS